jgi:hypothetical protein
LNRRRWKARKNSRKLPREIQEVAELERYEKVKKRLHGIVMEMR